ncbi:heparan-alpha-glucosaminide N-acetyltransferase [Jannaschia sp. M317]|uniref:heparan-alpha-glucosaminide N-acetyltransferase n=1 Tax=Jannaschia sp. M317 TaxID=2867011 RepID=UPI0021A930D4|nr:heparan-alpha-glucosaminide N-acetyltransferase [Jannaschia sp. M317]UWQ18668.1 DUF1624 domain-containing protein [Jannaschia sp. M317]
MSGAAGRIAAIDFARTLAIANMVAFHFLFDLRMYGLAPPWLTYGALFDAWAKGIAGSFLALAGLGLWLAHGTGFQAGPFWRRVAFVAAGALAVSAATYVALPAAWVRFGILHAIALFSVVSLAFLWLPGWLTLIVAAALLIFGPGVSLAAFDGPAWIWTGLGTRVPPMMDYEPLVPWLAPMLIGLAVGRIGTRIGAWDLLRSARPGSGPLPAWLIWPGRHSLAIYLLHQPILIGLILGWMSLNR